MKHVIKYSSITFGILFINAAVRLFKGKEISDAYVASLLLGATVAVCLAGATLNTLRETGYFKK